MVGPRLRRAAQLRQHDDRDVQLLGQSLERARNRGQFERASRSNAVGPFRMGLRKLGYEEGYPAIGSAAKTSDRQNSVTKYSRPLVP